MYPSLDMIQEAERQSRSIEITRSSSSLQRTNNIMRTATTRRTPAGPSAPRHHHVSSHDDDDDDRQSSRMMYSSRNDEIIDDQHRILGDDDVIRSQQHLYHRRCENLYQDNDDDDATTCSNSSSSNSVCPEAAFLQEQQRLYEELTITHARNKRRERDAATNPLIDNEDEEDRIIRNGVYYDDDRFPVVVTPDVPPHQQSIAQLNPTDFSIPTLSDDNDNNSGSGRRRSFLHMQYDDYGRRLIGSNNTNTRCDLSSSRTYNNDYNNNDAFEDNDCKPRATVQSNNKKPSSTKKSNDKNDKDDKMIEVSPGYYMRLRGADETRDAITKDFFMPSECPCCSHTIFCIQDADFVLCPHCVVVSPLAEQTDPFIDGGVGLGITMDELSRYQEQVASGGGGSNVQRITDRSAWR